MNTKENGTHRQASAAPNVKHEELTIHSEKSQIKQQQLFEAIRSIDMGEFMPVAKIEMGKEGNPLWRLEGRIQSLELVFDSVRGEGISPSCDLVFKLWHNAYLQHCKQTGLLPQSEEDLFMLWSSCGANRLHPEKRVKLAFELAKTRPFPVEAVLFEGQPTIQLIVAALKIHAELSKEGGRMLCTNEQIAEEIGKCREITGRYIENLCKIRRPLLYRVTCGKKGSPSEYLFLSKDVLSRAKLPDLTTTLLDQANPSPYVDYVRMLLSQCP